VSDEMELELRAAKARILELESALGRLADRHRWSPHFDSGCVCAEHLRAAELLKPKGPT
jgi:hypothetical protein